MIDLCSGTQCLQAVRILALPPVMAHLAKSEGYMLPAVKPMTPGSLSTKPNTASGSPSRLLT